MLTKKRLQQLLEYNPKNGIFTRKTKSSNSVNVGDIAGCKNLAGYITISIDNKPYLAHRLAWLYTYGEMPKEGIDHINHNKIDNRINNLRVVPQILNMRNLKMRNTNTSGITGVRWNKKAKKWIANINVHYKSIYLGLFIDINDAKKARKDAEKKYNFHVNHE